VLKPREPNPCDGKADIQAFYKFMRQAKEYLSGHQLDKARYVSTLSNFLTGKAYRFFSISVSGNPEVWTLKHFFVELFNYCFPADFRQHMQNKLQASSQEGRTVRKFAHELEGLFMMVGGLTDEQKVNKLWYGLKPSLQQGL
ncbi:hypothetical protein OBBRIDRAFT_742530, partial [Obba rivulosa]